MTNLETLKKHDDWNESYYFNFHDQRNDLTAFMRIGNKINKDEKMMFFYLMGDQLLGGMNKETNCGDHPLENNGLEFQEIETGKWRIIYNGPIINPLDHSAYQVVMDIVWTARNPVMDYMDCVDRKGVELSSSVASGHIEQFGTAVGEVKIDDKKYQITGLGERDQSIGVRAWASPKMWMWINSAFSEEAAFNITKLTVDEGEVDAGYFYTNQANQALIKSDIDVEFQEGIPQKFTMALYDKTEQKYLVEGEVVRYGMIPVDENMILIETLSRYNWDGNEGYGIAEFLLPKKK
jgi:hypothetical protein